MDYLEGAGPCIANWGALPSPPPSLPPNSYFLDPLIDFVLLGCVVMVGFINSNHTDFMVYNQV